MELANVANVVGITVICGVVGMVSTNLLSKNASENEKWTPVIVAVVGGILGVLGMNIIPNYPADNIIDAIATGIISGLASTGAHQVYKQQTKSPIKNV